MGWRATGLAAAVLAATTLGVALDSAVSVSSVAAGDAETDVDALIAKLVGGDAKAGAAAADALVAMGASAVSKLAAAATSAASVATRVVALSTLGRIAADHDGAVAPLTATLADADPNVREAAALGLLAAGPRAKAAGPALVKLLADRFTNVRIAAAAAAIRSAFSGARGTARTTLDAGLSDKDALVRTAALKLVVRAGLPPDETRSAVFAAMKDADAGVRLTAISLLVANSSAGQEREEAITRLIAALDDPSDACRAAVIRAFVALNARYPHVIAAMRRDLALHAVDRSELVAAVPKLTDLPLAEALQVDGWLRGDRVARREKARAGAGVRCEAAVTAALDWLARHQSPDGSWSCDKYDARLKSVCIGVGGMPEFNAGFAQFTPGVTGLALLAFLGAGESQTLGAHKDVVARGLAYLVKIQGPDGRIGPVDGGTQYEHGSDRIIRADGLMYNHAVATVALCESFMLTQDPAIGGAATRAVEFARKAKNLYLAWGYEPVDGENDTSITGWMCWALAAARAAGIDVTPTPLKEAVAWIEKMTEPEFGRTGYRERGGRPARTYEENAICPADKSESLTAVGVTVRIFAGRTSKDDPFILKGASLLMKKLPKWDVDAGNADFYYWFWGSTAMRQVHGDQAAKWKSALTMALVSGQHGETGRCEFGSWDPIDAWSPVGGRVYATAMCCMALEAEWRMDSIVDAK